MFRLGQQVFVRRHDLFFKGTIVGFAQKDPVAYMITTATHTGTVLVPDFNVYETIKAAIHAAEQNFLVAKAELRKLEKIQENTWQFWGDGQDLGEHETNNPVDLADELRREARLPADALIEWEPIQGWENWEGPPANKGENNGTG